VGTRRTWRNRVALTLVGSAAALLITSCVGSIDRDAFDTEIRARGGGIDADRLLDALDDVTVSADGDVLIREATVTVQSVTVAVSPVSHPEEVDLWFAGSGLRGPEPTSSLDADELDAWFTADTVDPPLIEEAIDAALERSELRDPWASSLTLDGAPSETWTASVVLTNERATEIWTFGPDGEIEGQQ
jgi:hypothetical protein